MITQFDLNIILCRHLGWRSFRFDSGMAFPPGYIGEDETKLQALPDFINGPFADTLRGNMVRAFRGEEGARYTNRLAPTDHSPLEIAIAIAAALQLISDEEADYLSQRGKSPPAVKAEAEDLELDETLKKIREECCTAIRLGNQAIKGPWIRMGHQIAHSRTFSPLAAEALLFAIQALEGLNACHPFTLALPRQMSSRTSLSLYAKIKLREIVKQWNKSNPSK